MVSDFRDDKFGVLGRHCHLFAYISPIVNAWSLSFDVICESIEVWLIREVMRWKRWRTDALRDLTSRLHQ